MLSLGNEAFQWFARYADPAEVAALWERDDRYEGEITCRLEAVVGGETREKSIILGPLPHPSPLNARWYGRFPQLIAKRLAKMTY